ncbi:MAG: EAL domain-containing protein [Pseudomonadota bacterium]|nr:EAL domain-containing protein [Pseudomonadota bacterium]
MIEGLLDAAWLVDPDSLRILAANAAAATLLGIDVSTLCRTDALELSATPEDIAFWESGVGELTDSVDVQTFVSRADGKLVPVLRRVTRIRFGPGRGSAPGARNETYLVVMRDRSLELRTQAELEERLSELRATLDSTTDGILVTDLSGRIVNFNPRFVALWGVPESLLTEHDDAAVSSWMLRRVSDPVSYTKRLHAIGESSTLEGSDVLTLRCGKVIERRTLPQRNRGQPIGRVFAFRDVSESLETNRRIDALSNTDALTGLPNRRVVASRIEYALALAQREGVAFALLHLNLDRFKPINDALGSAAGDRMLVEVSKRLIATMRQVDAVSRVGADEYVILVHQADMQRAEGAARRLLDALKPPFTVDGMNLTITASIGISLYPGDGSTSDELLQAADDAMNDLKASGGAGYRFHHQPVGATVVKLRTRMKLDHAMRQALASGRFRLHYQPQVDLNSGEIVGAEALIRWRDPELGDVPPAEFIPAAESSGFIVAIGAWVLRQAVQQAALWHGRGHRLLMSINVSALQFQQPDFVDSVARALAEVGLDPQWLELELTESILIQDAQEALHRLQALAQLGVKLAIDDFGTGYSSLAYLKRFPIGRLKIDRSFVRGLPKDEADVGIVNAIVNLGKALHLDMVAEGVETEAQRLFMLNTGCTQYQGSLCSPAIDALSFDALLDRGLAFAQDMADDGGWIEGGS